MPHKLNSRLAGEFADRVCDLCVAELRAWCEQEGVSQYQLCKRTGISRDMMSRIMTEKSRPGMHNIGRIFYGLGMRDAQFLRMVARMGGGGHDSVKSVID